MQRCVTIGVWLVWGVLSLGPSVGWGQQLQYPISVAATADRVYVADRNLPGIWKWEADRLEVFFQASKRFRTPLNAVRCVALTADGQLLAGDSATRDLYRFDEQGKPQPLTGGEIGIPMDIAVDPRGGLWVSDLELHCIWKVSLEGGKPEKVAELRGPRGLSSGPDGALWVVCAEPEQLVKVAADGTQQTLVKGQPFRFPQDVAVDDQGTAYVSDNYGKTIWRMAAGQAPSKWLEGAPLVSPVGLAWQGDRLLVADPRVPAILQVDQQGQITPLVK